MPEKSEKSEKLVFGSLRRELKGKDELMIVGGTITEEKLVTWLVKFSKRQMPWRMWEWVNEFRLEHEDVNGSFPLPTRLEALERGRLFGKEGDLTVRRDGEFFRWHFIGPHAAEQKDKRIPSGWLSCHNYWEREAHKDKRFACFAQKALLWGAFNQELGRWYDNRVGFAHLEYPIQEVASLLEEDQKGHVYAYYREYLDAGQVAFVWMYGLGSLSKVLNASQAKACETKMEKVEPLQNESIPLEPPTRATISATEEEKSAEKEGSRI